MLAADTEVTCRTLMISGFESRSTTRKLCRRSRMRAPRTRRRNRSSSKNQEEFIGQRGGDGTHPCTNNGLCLIVLLLGVGASSLGIAQVVGELLVRMLGELRLVPEIRRQVGVSLRDGPELGLHEVTTGLGLTARLGVAIRDEEPHLPVTLHGTVCGAPKRAPHQPVRIGTKDSLASIKAPRIAFATSPDTF
jgi:hypothetical protein